MSAITLDQLRRRIERDSRQWGTPFEQQKKTLARLEANPLLRICPKCEGEQGYITVIGLYSGCDSCGGRGVKRKHWWHFHVELPPSFYDEPSVGHYEVERKAFSA